MKRTDILFLIGIIVIVVLGVWMWSPNTPEDEDAPVVTDSTASSAQALFFEWTIKDLSEIDVAVPKTELTLNVTGDMEKNFLVGSYDLMCAQQTIAGNEISAIACWFAGGGVDIAVFKENGVYVVKERDVDEGTAEGGGSVGSFKTILEIK